jgi:hypothetical protein
MAILDNLESSDFFWEDKKELPFSWNPQGCIPHHNSESAGKDIYRHMLQ